MKCFHSKTFARQTSISLMVSTGRPHPAPPKQRQQQPRRPFVRVSVSIWMKLIWDCCIHYAREIRRRKTGGGGGGTHGTSISEVVQSSHAGAGAFGRFGAERQRSRVEARPISLPAGVLLHGHSLLSLCVCVCVCCLSNSFYRAAWKLNHNLFPIHVLHQSVQARFT